MCSPQTTDLSGSIHQFWRGICCSRIGCRDRLQYGISAPQWSSSIAAGKHLLHHDLLHGLQGVSALVLISASSPSSPFSALGVCKVSHTFFLLTPLRPCNAFAFSYAITEMQLSWLTGSAVPCSGATWNWHCRPWTPPTEATPAAPHHHLATYTQ